MIGFTFVCCLFCAYKRVGIIGGHHTLEHSPRLHLAGTGAPGSGKMELLCLCLPVLDSQASPAVHTAPVPSIYKFKAAAGCFSYGLGSMAQGYQGTLDYPESSQIPTPQFVLILRLTRAHSASLAVSPNLVRSCRLHGLA